MSKLKDMWNNNRKTLLLYGGIGLAVLILIIVLVVILVLVFRKYDYPEIEKKMVEASLKYMNHYKELMPAENDFYEISVDDLVQNKYLKELSKLSKDSSCIGSVKVDNQNNSLRYTPKLECNNYQTTSLSETILNRETIVSENAGLYDINDYYTYRGEYVNNYVNFVNYSWRILKFDEDKMYLILSDTLNDTTYVFDDRYNESIEGYRGKSEFSQSRIKTSLMNIYDNYFKNKHAYLKTMDACVHTRSELDTDKAGNIECYTTLPLPISLLSVYDYMNASVDPLCTRSTSRNCSNYNYLAKTTNKWWLMNGTNENTYDVYSSNQSGALSLEYANTKKYLRVVIAIPSDVIYKSGNGTSSKPFTFYEY